MKTVELGEVAAIERRGVHPTALSPDTLYLGLEHVERGGRIIGHNTVGGAEVASTKFRFTRDHVLYGKLRPNLGKISRPEFAGVCSTDILPIRPGPHLDRGYLAHYLALPGAVDLAASRATGANLPRLSPTVLASFPIPLPPLDEQRRIAAILDHADTLRAKRLQVLAHLDVFAQSIFHEMVSSASASATLRDVGVRFRYGTSNKAGPSGYPALRIPNVIGGSLDLEEIKTVDVAPAEFDRLRLLGGDLLFVRSNGNPDNVGRCAIFDPEAVQTAAYDPSQWIYASYLIRARLSSNVVPVFLAAYLAGPLGRRQLRDRSKTSAGQYNINTEGLGSLQVPTPPLQLQHAFAARVERVNAQRAAEQRAIAADDELFASLQSRAFRGEL